MCVVHVDAVALVIISGDQMTVVGSTWCRVPVVCAGGGGQSRCRVQCVLEDDEEREVYVLEFIC